MSSSMLLQLCAAALAGFMITIPLKFELVNGAQARLNTDKTRATLVSIGQELGVSGWGLQSSYDFCSWPGITCDVESGNSTVQKLDLSNRSLRGNLTVIAELESLKSLDLSSNGFHGPVPPELGNLSALEFLDLSFNYFDGSIPRELGNLINLRFLNLSSNLLVGEIPHELRNLEKLLEFQVSSNNLSGPIPLWLGKLSSLRVFSAYKNEFDSMIPENIGLFSELEMLNLHSNHLQGPIPKSIFASGKLEVLILTQNRLTGEIPEDIGHCTSLSSVRIGNNKLVGNLPIAIGNCSSLTYFEADNNILSGEIASDIARCSNITLLNLASNSFTGTIPSEFGNLLNLQELILSSNDLSGDIPLSIIMCKNLSKLDLSDNRFNSSIPKEICEMPRLQFLYLDQNSMRGEIPREIGNCVKLLELQISRNYLTGNIPSEIGHLKNLQISLNLSFNNLHGPLPPDLGRLDKLVSLDVSNNQLSGSIPSEFRGMLSLIEVNFSNNLLVGPVPRFGPFQKCPNSSFSGNRGLCGEPLLTSCQGSFGNDHENRHGASYRTIAAIVGSGLAVFASITIVVFLFMMRERQEMVANSKSEGAIEEEKADTRPTIEAGNVFIDNLKQAIDLEAVVKATLKDSNKLMTGTFSTVYRAMMPSGLIILVKKLRCMDRTVIHHRNKMIRELERLSRLSHDNLMQPIGFVIYEDVALLLHHYLPNGTLAQLLHKSSGETEYKPEWPLRLSIAIGVAQGLAFLHHVAVIHLDISSANVLLDLNFKPLLGEIEISKLLDPSRGTASISAVAGSFGYIPPEYAYTMQVTAPGNVYSYGVILLEILTTRLPVDEGLGEDVDLVKWVHSAPTRGDTPEQILDARLSTVSFSWRKEMLAALKVALLCTDSVPAKRPKMKKVVEMLQEIEQS
ncbi:hypothetical protein SAY87_018675 [Trapa incisa]|uniref:Protein kinase domain-containing protein n=1 Tax=Trapa incisa TaxID=236973 RepID=A0AAN7K141_9MYRT|nr:hypothetical protein SAY87_018675 [Trapa incisa]